MKYLYLVFALFLVGCNEIKYYRTTCEVLPNDTGYANELMLKSKEIRESVLATYSQKGSPQARYENEDMDDEIEAMSDLIKDQIQQTQSILDKKYCKEVDEFYKGSGALTFTTANIKDTMQLRILKQIKVRSIKEME